VGALGVNADHYCLLWEYRSAPQWKSGHGRWRYIVNTSPIHRGHWSYAANRPSRGMANEYRQFSYRMVRIPSLYPGVTW
jgi:hypothetical protein